MYLKNQMSNKAQGILHMLFCKKLLAVVRDQHSSLVTSKESSQKNQNNDRPTFCHGHHNYHVVEHLVRKKCMVFKNADPSVASCKDTFKREFLLVILRAKERHKENMSVWLNSSY
jgi:hypothetical protein